MRLRFTPRARRHLDAIYEYITERNPDAARRVGARIRESIDLLALFPDIGHEGALPETLEMVVPGLPYVERTFKGHKTSGAIRLGKRL